MPINNEWWLYLLPLENPLACPGSDIKCSLCFRGIQIHDDRFVNEQPHLEPGDRVKIGGWNHSHHLTHQKIAKMLLRFLPLKFIGGKTSGVQRRLATSTASDPKTIEQEQPANKQ